MSNIVRIVAAVVSQTNLVLYKENGETITILQGDSRVKNILDKAIPDIKAQNYSDIDLTKINPYVEFENKSSGLIKFFKVARSKLASLLGSNEEPKENETIGTIPSPKDNLANAVAEIIANATPVSDHSFNENNTHKQRDIISSFNDDKPARLDNEETIVAVVDNKCIVPDVELIKKQINYASVSDNTLGMENLIKRVSAVISERGHSIQDLLRFLERSDLPIADDGSIIIYKILNKLSADQYVDVHSGNVNQYLGSRVFMDVSLVDPNRRNECSNGLHVARRAYIRSFSGTTCVIAKLNPEDVIAVPEYDANKMRVCGYHILEELTYDEFSLLKKNIPITDIQIGKERLARILAGNHIGITSEVCIGGHNGTMVTTTYIEPVKKDVPEITDMVGEVNALDDSDSGAAAPVVPVLEVQDKLSDTPPPALVVQTTVENEGSYRDRINKLISIGLDSPGVMDKIMELKKKSKKSWDVLGVSDKDQKKILKKLG